MNDKKKKLEAQEFGKFAEEIAVREYILNGNVVLERNWRLGKTEIDIIVQKNNTIVFVEVKARSGKDEDPFYTLTNDKKRRMINAADVYIRRLKGDFEYRFDFVTLTGNMCNYTFEILKDAFLSTDLL